MILIVCVAELDLPMQSTSISALIKAAKFEGETGIGEAGLVFKPSSKSPWLVDLGVQGYVGKREGVSGSLRVGLEF
ncbi:hypothetical protein AGMMS49925_07930 [Deltaproteobacteria bacterium]|nr:hypothetical protein AGMMS49925_07930 [Deltaproteobacteria bacterium]